MNEQLVLGVMPFDDSGLDAYVDPSEGKLLFYLHSLLEQDCLERFIYLWGSAGLGKTHLLNAVVNDANERGMMATYFDCCELVEHPVDIIEGMAAQEVLAFDNIQAICGHRDWQQALFNLYNQIRDNGRTRLLVASDESPGQLPLELPDLKSRLAWGVTFKLLPLDEGMKQELLQKRAAARGFELSDQMTQYILTHHGRQQRDLMTLLERLDIASLQAQRKITIPFIREILKAS